MQLITSHLGTDLDGLAAMVAVRLLEGEALELGLPGSMDPVTNRFHRERGEELAPLVAEAELRERLEREPLERLIVVDTADRARLGWLADYVERFDEVIAYDTHDAPGDLPRAPLADAGACVAPLVLSLRARGVTPTAAQAGLFLLGIHTDTGHFVFPGTTAVDHEAAAACVAWEAPLEWVSDYVPQGLDRHRLRLMERMARGVRQLDAAGHRVAILSLDLDEYEPDLAPLLDLMRRAEGWDAAFLLAADPHRTSVIGRSSGTLDVAAVLRALGGGGHPEAAAAALHACPLPEAWALLVEALEVGARPLTARGLASQVVYELSSDATVREAGETLHRYRVNALPLVEGGAHVGLVSLREVDDALRHGLGDRPAAAISTGPPAWVPPDAPVEDVRQALLSNPGRLILVGAPDTGPIGVVTRSSVFRSHALDPPLAAARRGPGRHRVQAALDEALTAADQSLIEQLGGLAEALDERLFLVGGAVRDVLLGRSVEDLDLVVVGDAPTLGRAACERFGGHLHVHEAFNTCTWTTGSGRKIDLTSARTESYRAPAALPVVARGSLRHDLYRRDFSINAMALEVGPSHAGRLVDPFGGQTDLEQRTLRVLHGLSFHDDPTRAWRAARFAGRFDFTLAPGTQALLREALRAGFVARLSPERLGAELHKLLAEAQAVRCVAMLRDWDLLHPIHPAIAGDHDLLDRVARVREAWVRYRALVGGRGGALPSAGDPQWIALGWPVPTPDRKALRRLTAGTRGRTAIWAGGPTHVREAIRQLRRSERRSEQAAALVDLDAAELIATLAVGGPDAQEPVLWWLRQGSSVAPTVTARELLARGAAPGPAVGSALRAARAAAWDGADAEAQLAAAEAALAACEGR